MANEEAKLFVAGLPDSISEEVLKQLFEATGGKVVGVSLPKDRLTGRPRGFGFVTLATPRRRRRRATRSTARCRRASPSRCAPSRPSLRSATRSAPARAASRRWSTRARAVPAGRPQQAPDRTLYVGNLPYDATQEEVQVLVNGGRARQRRPRAPADGRRRSQARLRLRDDGEPRGGEGGGRRAPAGRPSGPAARREPGPSQGRAARAAAGGGGGGGGFSAPFPPSFGGGGGGGGGPSGPTHRKPAAHEERRKRSFEDGGGPKNRGKRGEREERGGANSRIDYGTTTTDERESRPTASRSSARGA